MIFESGKKILFIQLPKYQNICKTILEYVQAIIFSEKTNKHVGKGDGNKRIQEYYLAGT